MKPILFNTEMVRAILDGRKTVTRRVVKPQSNYEAMTAAGQITSENPITIEDGLVVTKNGDITTWGKLPYRPGDILYVRETWAVWSPTYGMIPEIIYKADGYSQSHKMKWRPSIHMPREAARIFLRVTDVRVERLQDITEDDAREEGVAAEIICRKPFEAIPSLERFKKIWDSTIKPADRALYGWEANPWVWVIGFERISKEEADNG